MNPDSTLAVTQTCPKDGVHLSVTYTFYLSDDLRNSDTHTYQGDTEPYN